MDLAYVKGFEHRSMAVGLPFVLHNLIPENDLGERVAVSYALWRRAIDYYDFCESPIAFDRGGVISLTYLDELGANLQRDMNALKQFVTTEPNAEFEGASVNYMSKIQIYFNPFVNVALTLSIMTFIS